MPENWVSLDEFLGGSASPTPSPQESTPAPSDGNGWVSLDSFLGSGETPQAGNSSQPAPAAPAQSTGGQSAMKGVPYAALTNGQTGAKWENPLTLLYRALNIFGGVAEEGAKASHNSGMVPGVPLAYQFNDTVEHAAPLSQRAGDAFRAAGTGFRRAMDGDDVGFGQAIREAAKGTPAEEAITRPFFGKTVRAGVPFMTPGSEQFKGMEMPTPPALAKLDPASLAGVPLDLAGQLGAAKLLGLAGKLGGSAAKAAGEGLAARLAPWLETKAGKTVALTGDALRAVGRDIAGQVSFEGGFSGLAEGKDVAQLMREHQGGIMSGQVQNRARMQPLANGLVNATKDEKAVLTYLTEMPTTAEAQAKAARQAATTAEEAQKQAVLNYKAPSPFDTADIANQTGLVQRANASLPGPEFSAIQRAAEGAGQTPEQAIADIAQRAYGHQPGVGLNPGQRGQITRAFGEAQNLDEGYTNLADLIRSEGTHGPGEFGTAVRNKAAMDPAGADPFNMTTEQRHQSLTDQLAQLEKEHKWTSDKYDFNVSQLARGAAQEINATNSSARHDLFQEILSHGRIRPGSGIDGADSTLRLPSFLKSVKNGMGLDELASSLRGGMSQQDLVSEILGVTGKAPVSAKSAQAVKEAEQRFLASPEGQKLRDLLTAHGGQIDALQEELGPLAKELAAKRAPFDDLPAGEFPRPSWSQTPAAQAAPTTSPQAKMIAEGALTQANGDRNAAIASVQSAVDSARVKAAEGSPLAKAVLRQQEEALAHLQSSAAPAAEAATQAAAQAPELTADHLRAWLDNPQNLDQLTTRNVQEYGWKDAPGSKFWTKERDGIERILRNEVLPGVEAGNPQAWRVQLGPGGSAGDMVTESLAAEAKAAEAAGGIPGAGGAQAGAQASHNINLDAIPEQYRHLAQPVMDKYGHLIPDIRSLTDEAYAKIQGFAPDTGYVEYYTPRISRAGQEGDSAYTKFLRNLAGDNRAIPTKEGQMAGALTNRPGFTKGRTLDTMGAFADNATANGGHAVLDQVDALLTHLDRATQAEQAVVLRDKLLGLGENVAVKAKEVPPGFMDMSHIPGWNGISVREPYGKALEQLLAPDTRGKVATLYDKSMGQIKEATFYNPAVHGKNLAYRAFVTGNSPIPSEMALAEVKEFGPTLRALIEHGGAAEYSARGEQGAQKLYRVARQANKQATLGDKLHGVADVAHNSLWEYDKALRVDYAKKLRAQGLGWPEVAKQVNDTYGASLDPTKFNQNFTKRAFFTPAWMANNLKFTAKNALNPRVIMLNDLREGANRLNTGHGTEENANGKEEYTALGPPGDDNKQLFLNFNTPDKDLREVMRNPLDWLWQRVAPIPRTVGGMTLGNSRPFDSHRGVDYTAPGAAGPLLGYRSNGFGPDVSLRTQAAASQALPLLGYPWGSLASEGAGVGRSQNPLRDLFLRLGGMYASDVNEPLSKALDFRQQQKDKRTEIRTQTLRQWKRQNGK